MNNVRTLDIPVSPGRSVAIQLPTQGLTEAEWSTFDAVITAMRPSLTAAVKD